VRLPVFKPRTPPIVEQELDWYFTCSESEMGLASNFAPLVAMALTGVVGTRSDPADTMAERRIAAAHAEGQIRKRLRLMPTRLVGVLEAAYEPRAWPPELLRHFGRVAGIAVRTRAARALEKARAGSNLDSVASSLAAAINRNDHALLATVRSEAESILRPALQAYESVRGPGPCITPKDAHAG
jgi:hypothetical protein